METYYQDNHITIYNKDCRDMSDLPDNSVQCVITSPPYWGLRKYSGEQDLIWGDNHCQHNWGALSTKEMNYVQGNPEFARPHREHKNFTATTNICSLCGAWKGAFGLEPTPEMYIQHTIEILREIRRVLRKDGVVFWNIGDSYASGKGSCFNPGGGEDSLGKTKKEAGAHPLHRGNISNLKVSGLKPKDLCLIPFRIAIAAQEDGWWVRSVIIWSKPNPMPESVTDRPTESHEYILMLTKNSRYYWDADAVREKQLQQSIDRMTRSHLTDYDPNYPIQGPQNLHFGQKLSREEAEAMSGRNIRTVWEFPTQPYPEAHFAVFPEKLPEICIKAATPEVGCCSKCGAPWERVINEQSIPTRNISGNYKTRDPARHIKQSDTIGWQPTCKCNADKIPSLVLDSFAGAGTTLRVAKKLNRRAVGYEVSEEYCRLALDRNRQLVLSF